MNSFHAVLLQLRALETIGWVLLHSLWQDTLVAAVLAIVIVCLRRRSPQIRYVLACLAMGLMAVLPILTCILAFRSTPPPAIGDAISVAVPPLDDVVQANSTPAPGAAVGCAEVFPNVLRATSCAWLAGIVVLSGWNLLGWLRVRHLRLASCPAPLAWQKRLEKLSQLIESTARVTLRVSERLSTPAVLGWLQPVVLVPASALMELPAEQLEALLLHELAHVRRCDYLVNLIQTVIETVLFYHPAVWWCGSVMRAEREHCCDDVAAKHCGSKLLYARALAALEQLRATALPAWAMGATGGKLLRRIERIVGISARQSRPKSAAIGIALPVLVLGGTLLAIGWRSSLAGPTTAPAATAPAALNTVQPSDLVAGPVVDYKICANDLLATSIGDLVGPGIVQLRQIRVSETGRITLPYLPVPIRVEGLTQAEIEQAIIKAYADARIIAHAAVSVTVLERHGDTYIIGGHIEHPGVHTIQGHDFRLLDAIAAAGGTDTDPGTIKVLRKELGKTDRTIEVPGDKLLDGDANFNIVVRPHDTILVDKAAHPPQLSLVLQGITRDGDRHLANIDGKWLAQGDSIQSKVGRLDIETITDNSVVIVRSGTRRTVQLGESLYAGKIN